MQLTPLQLLNTRMAMQKMKEDLCGNYLDLGLIQQKLKFFESCVSEGLIPKGFRGSFNLAMDVNDEEFVNEAQNIMDERCSRLLDLAYQQTCKTENNLLEINHELKEQAMEAFGRNHSEIMFQESIRNSAKVVEGKGQLLTNKLRILRRERQNVNNDAFVRNGGSRQLVGKKYMKAAQTGEVQGAPFPKYMRKARRNRPHRRDRNNVNVIRNDQEYVVTAADLEERNPIIASKKNIEISEDAKALYRKGPKFCPSPRGPIDEMEQYKSFLRFQQSVRWKWVFNKNRDPLNIDDEYHAKPWDTRTERSAPIATDAPELEAFLSALEKDIKNPELRRNIKSNLNENQWKYIKEDKSECPVWV